MAIFKGRIGIIGAGALGAFYGARLARAGHEVRFLMRSDYDAVRKHGLFVKSFEGDFHLEADVYDSPEAMGVCDLLIIGLKTTTNAALPTLLGPTTSPDTIVLTLQNGLGNEDAIARALENTSNTSQQNQGGSGVSPLKSASRVLGGIAFLCSNRTAPGHIHHMDHGWIRMGEFAAPVTERTHAIAELFKSAEIRCEVYDNLMQARWEKLVWNIPFNGLGVAAKADVGQVLASPELRAVARNLMDETVRAAAATGAQIDPAMPEKMLKNSESMGPYHSSMQVDYEQGRPLEVESIIGEPTRRAQSAGASVPHMAMLYALVKAVGK